MEYIVFGASKLGHAFSLINNAFPIAYFCDNDRNKWGISFCDKKVISPDQLLKMYDPEKYTIVITSMYSAAIRAQLMKMGIENFVIFNTDMRPGFFEEEREIWSFVQKYIDQNSEFSWNGIPFENAESMRYQKEITIMIYTYNRLENLKKCISYFGSINNEKLGIRLLILDASPTEIQDQIDDFIENIPQDRVRLCRFSEGYNIWQRFAEGMQYVKTEYVTFCGDDDFYFPDGLLQSSNFLDQNRDYLAARGKALYFYNNKLTDFEYSTRIRLIKSISDDDVAVRIKQWGDFSGSLLCLVYRTQDLQTIMTTWKGKYPLVIKMNGQFAEWLFYFVLLSWGKMGAVSNKFHLRSATRQDTNVQRPMVYDSVLSGHFEENIDTSWEIYHEIFPHVCKEKFLQLLCDFLFQVFFLEGTVKEKNLNPDTLKKAYENSPFWVDVVKARKQYGGWVESRHDTSSATAEWKGQWNNDKGEKG